MKNYNDYQNEGPEEHVLSEDQRDSLLTIKAPADLRGRIQQRVAESRNAVIGKRTGFPQLAAAGLLGFLSFLGSQALVGQLGGPRVASLEANNSSTNSSTDQPAADASQSDLVRDYHLQGVALLSTSDRYLDTFGPVGQSPEVVLATYLHERGGQK